MEGTKLSSNKKSYKTWSKREEINGITKSVSVEEVSNGYIITYCKYGKDSDDPNAEYMDETVKKISTTNPFEKKQEDDGFDGLMKSAASTIDEYL